MLAKAIKNTKLPIGVFSKNILQSTEILNNFYDDVKKMTYEISSYLKYDYKFNESIKKVKDHIKIIAQQDTFEFVTGVYIPNFYNVDEMYELLSKVKNLKKFRVDFLECLHNPTEQNFYDTKIIKRVYYEFFNSIPIEKTKCVKKIYRKEIEDHVDKLLKIFSEKARILEHLEIDLITLYVLIKKGLVFFPYLKTLRIYVGEYFSNNKGIVKTYDLEGLIARELKFIEICPLYDLRIIKNEDDNIKIIINQDNFPNLMEISYKTSFEEEFYPSEHKIIKKRVYPGIDIDEYRRKYDFIHLFFTGTKNFLLNKIDFFVEKTNKSFPLVTGKVFYNIPHMNKKLLQMFPNVQEMFFNASTFISLVQHQTFYGVKTLLLDFYDSLIFNYEIYEAIGNSFPNIESLKIKPDSNSSDTDDIINYERMEKSIKKLTKLKNFSLRNRFSISSSLTELYCKLMTFLPSITTIDSDIGVKRTEENELFIIYRNNIYPHKNILKNLFNTVIKIDIFFPRYSSVAKIEEETNSFMQKNIYADAIINNPDLEFITFNIDDDTDTDDSDERRIYQRFGEDCVMYDNHLLNYVIKHGPKDFFDKVGFVELSSKTGFMNIGYEKDFLSFNKPLYFSISEVSLGEYAVNVPRFMFQDSQIYVSVDSEVGNIDAFYDKINPENEKNILVSMDCVCQYVYIIDLVKRAQTHKYKALSFKHLGVRGIEWKNINIEAIFWECIFVSGDEFLFNNFSKVTLFDCSIRKKYIITDNLDFLHIRNTRKTVGNLGNITIESSKTESEIKILVCLPATDFTVPIINRKSIKGKFSYIETSDNTQIVNLVKNMNF